MVGPLFKQLMIENRAVFSNMEILTHHSADYDSFSVVALRPKSFPFKNRSAYFLKIKLSGDIAHRILA